MERPDLVREPREVLCPRDIAPDAVHLGGPQGSSAVSEKPRKRVVDYIISSTNSVGELLALYPGHGGERLAFAYFEHKVDRGRSGGRGDHHHDGYGDLTR